jgi:hypothetical protein
MYMPVGQCLLCRSEAYSNEIAARVTGLMDASDIASEAGESTADIVLADAFFGRPIPRSKVGEVINPLNKDIVSCVSK